MVGIARPLQELGVDFLLADVQTAVDLPQDEGQAVAAREGVTLIVPMPQPGRFRLILHVPGDTGEPREPGWYDDLIRRRTGLAFNTQDVQWVSLFTLRSGTAERLRAGPVFVLGDAAHLQSPVGGQGLNLGIQDAHNLAWKLAHVHRGWADPGLLDSYEEERRPIARRMVRITSLATRVISLRFVPLWLIRGLVASIALRLPWLQRRFGPALGMAGRPYAPGIAVASGRSLGPIRCGARLPDLRLPDGSHLHDHLHPERRTVLAPTSESDAEDHWVEVPEASWRAMGLPPTCRVVVRPDRIVQSV